MERDPDDEGGKLSHRLYIEALFLRQLFSYCILIDKASDAPINSFQVGSSEKEWSVKETWTHADKTIILAIIGSGVSTASPIEPSVVVVGQCLLFIKIHQECYLGHRVNLQTLISWVVSGTQKESLAYLVFVGVESVYINLSHRIYVESAT